MKKVLIYLTFFVLMFSMVLAQHTATSLNIEVGSLRSGNLQSTFELDGNYLIIDEVAETPGYDIRFIFTDVESFTTVQNVFRYDGGAGNHIVNIELYNFNTSEWDTISQYDKSSMLLNYVDYVPNSARYINDSIVIMRHNHATAGDTSHYLEIDFVGLDANLQIEEDDDDLNIYMIIIIIFLIIFALITKMSILGIFAGIGMLFIGFTFLYSNIPIGIVTFCSGLLIMLYFLLIEG